MKNKFIMSICIFVFTSISVFGQATEINKPKYERVSEAYGFITGQEYSLGLIQNEFPNLELNIVKAQIAFDLSFGNTKEKMKNYLSEFLGNSRFKEFEDNSLIKMQETFGNQTLTEEIARTFIIEVESRAKGNIVTPVLETLLSFQYASSPQSELMAGFSTIFKTKGHPKSKNTDWQIKVPRSWRAEEADRPNIIQKFISDFGTGNQSIMLMVKEMQLPVGYKISKEELDGFFSEKEMKDIVPEGGKLISFSKMTFDKNAGGMIEYEQIVKRLDFEIKIRMAQFMFIRGNQMYILQGMVSTDKVETNMALEMQKYLPLYKLVANTIVVNDQYK
jgi:hypothetical protein